MRATSRESLSAVSGRFDEVTTDVDIATLRQLGDELSAVAALLAGERVLRRHLADPAAAELVKAGLVDRVFQGKLSESALTLLREIVSRRWSGGSDLVDAIESLARQALLTAAEQDGTLDETEDELFRFGRLLTSEDRLRELLSDPAAPVEGRLQLLHRLLDGKAGSETLQLLVQAVRTPRGRGLDVMVAQLAELAAARRQRSVAQVTAAAPLTAEQEDRLARLLARIYGKTMSIQVVLDPEVVGGLVVRVGDEVIDGSIASRLAKAEHELPG
jgi:F-type H+-transporting ATPase subunit delta